MPLKPKLYLKLGRVQHVFVMHDAANCLAPAASVFSWVVVLAMRYSSPAGPLLSSPGILLSMMIRPCHAGQVQISIPGLGCRWEAPCAEAVKG